MPGDMTLLRQKIVAAVEKELRRTVIPSEETVVSMDVYLRVSFYVEKPVMIDVHVKLDER